MMARMNEIKRGRRQNNLRLTEGYTQLTQVACQDLMVMHLFEPTARHEIDMSSFANLCFHFYTPKILAEATEGPCVCHIALEGFEVHTVYYAVLQMQPRAA
jgi:hypothetical protein